MPASLLRRLTALVRSRLRRRTRRRRRPVRERRTDHHALRFAPIRIGTPQRAVTVHRNGYNQDGQNWSGYAATGSRLHLGHVQLDRAVGDLQLDQRPDRAVGRHRRLRHAHRRADRRRDRLLERLARSTRAGTRCTRPRRSTTATRCRPATHITATVTPQRHVLHAEADRQHQGLDEDHHQDAGRDGNASVEVIMESPTGAYPNFGTVNFTSSTVNGAHARQHRSPVAAGRQQLRRLRGPHQRAERRHELLDQLPARVTPPPPSCPCVARKHPRDTRTTFAISFTSGMVS